jgi:uncharacterized protein YggE
MRTKSLLIAFAVIFPLALSAQAETLPRIISVTGTSLTKVAPDTIVWSISVQDTSQVLVDAKRANDDKLIAIMALLEDLDVSQEDINSGSLNIRKVFNRDEQGNRTLFQHFSVSRHVTAKQHDMERFDEFLEKLVSAAEVEVGFSLEGSDVTEARYGNRLEAVKLAKRKAEDMLEVLGSQLGRVISVNEHPPSSGLSQNGIWTNNFQTTYGSQPQVSDDSVTGTFSPGAIDIRTTVYVTFEIR